MRRFVLLALVVALTMAALAAVVHWTPARSITPPIEPGAESPGASPSTLSTTSPPAPAGRSDVAVSAPLARAREVLAAIEARGGEPLPGYVGGRTFQNRERRLPAGRYREYDLYPRVPGQNRGPERLIVDQRTGRAYYTGDHYRTFVSLN
jgi:ribonuclease T1